MEREPGNPTSHNLPELAWLSKADVAAARARFEHALELDPAYLPAAHNLATIDIRENQVERARQRYRAVLARRPDDTQAMTELARIDAAHGRVEEAVRTLEKARAKDSSNVDPQILLTEIYLQLQELKKAQALAEELANRNETNMAVLFVLARTYAALKKTDRAASVFRRMTRSEAFSPQWLTIVAAYQIELGDLDGARWSLENVQQEDPAYVNARQRLVEIELREDRWNEAFERARKLQKTHPTLAAGHLLEGDALMQMGKVFEAITAYQAGQQKQASAAAVVRLYHARRSAGAEGDALEQLSQWVEAHPEDQVARRTLAAGYLQAGRLKEAINQHELLLETDSDDSHILNNLAWLYQETGDKRALSYAERAHRLAPTDPGTLDTIGWILVQQGKPGRGILYLRKAQARAPKKPHVRYHLAVALNDLGRNDEARQQLQEVLKSGQDFDGATEAQALLRNLSGG